MTDVISGPSIGAFVAEEATGSAARQEPLRHHPPRLRARVAPPRRVAIWAGATLALALWAIWSTGVGRRAVLNPGGWPLVAKFLRASVDPDLSRSFVGSTFSAALTTIAYASLGTVASVIIGVLGGVLLSRTTWRRRLGVGNVSRSRLRVGQLALVLPRGIHEAVWGLFLVTILGRNPLVAVLAIAIPFGAITAKVYADLIDSVAAGSQRGLRSAGVSRVAALVYGILPATVGDLVSYGFYRFECSIRAAVVLGLVGAGGLGFQLAQSFQGLAYREMWTSIYALVALGAVAELWSRAVRRRRHALVGWSSVACAMVLVALSWWHLHIKPASLVAPRTKSLLQRLAVDAWPPRLPTGGWTALGQGGLATLHMSLLAILIAVVLAVPVALIGVPGVFGSGPGARALSFVVRGLALVTRSIPPTVWALLVLFVVFPGMLPGAVALGIYTAGVLARLLGEVVENLDQAPRRALASAGAGRVAAFAYGSLSELTPRWTVFALYRWEVAAREAAVVGVVGAGGLGRMLAQQTASFDYSAMLSTIAGLIVVTLIVDVISARLRR